MCVSPVVLLRLKACFVLGEARAVPECGDEDAFSGVAACFVEREAAEAVREDELALEFYVPNSRQFRIPRRWNVERTHRLSIVVADHHARLRIVHERRLAALIPSSDDLRIIFADTFNDISDFIEESGIHEALEGEYAGDGADVC